MHLVCCLLLLFKINKFLLLSGVPWPSCSTWSFCLLNFSTILSVGGQSCQTAKTFCVKGCPLYSEGMNVGQPRTAMTVLSFTESFLVNSSSCVRWWNTRRFGGRKIKQWTWTNYLRVWRTAACTLRPFPIILLLVCNMDIMASKYLMVLKMEGL